TEDTTYYEVVGTAASIDVQIGGTVGVGDTFSVKIDWVDAGGVPQSATFTSGPILLGDEGTTVTEWEAVADDLLAQINGSPALIAAGISATDVGADGMLTIVSSPSTVNPIGEITVSTASTDGAGPDIPAVPTVITGTIDPAGTIEEGDIYRVDLDGDGTYDVQYEVQGGDTIAIIIDALVNEVNNTYLDPNIVASNVGDELVLTIQDGTNPSVSFDGLNYPGEYDTGTVTYNSVPVAQAFTFEVDANNDGDFLDAGEVVTYITGPGETPDDVAQALYDLADTDSDGLLDINTNLSIAVNGNAITVTGDQYGVNQFTVDANFGANAYEEDTWELTFTGLDDEEAVTTTIASAAKGGPAQIFQIAWAGTIDATLQNLKAAIEAWAASGTDISANINVVVDGNKIWIEDISDDLNVTNTDVVVTGVSDGGSGTEVDHTQGSAGVGGGSITIFNDNAPDGAGVDNQDMAETDRVIGSVEVDDPVQVISPATETDGVDSADAIDSATVDFVNEDAFLYNGADIFITQGVDMTAGGVNWQAFEASGFDNDDIPYDFRGVLSGNNPAGQEYNDGFDGADGGVKNVTYVGDWDGGASHGGLDMLAFEKVAGGSLGPAGNALNYAEFENIATTRDDADATAASLFEGAPGLRYIAIARDDGNAALGENFLRVYYNEAGTDKAPEAVFELVGYQTKDDITFTDITNVTQCDTIHDLAGVNDIND
ncbi:MAG: hypothetical protein KDC47_09960, partial [Flavobacteriaceae bacterium]|nr:hypothetical protein [Flavobacteriaceae bacterium]